MPDIFTRVDVPDPAAPPLLHKVKLRLRQGKMADQQVGTVCELLIDDKPITGLLQELRFTVNAEDQVVRFGFDIIPRDVDIEIDADMAQLCPEIIQAFCLTKTEPQYVRRLPSTEQIDQKINEYKAAFPRQ